MFLGNLKIQEIFVYSTKFNKLTENCHKSTYEFLEYIKRDETLTEDTKEYILSNLSNIYTLSAVYAMDYHSEWKYVLNKKQHEKYEKNEEYIIGYMILNPQISGKGVYFIEYIETRITQHNLATYMIRKYEELMWQQHEKTIVCLPHAIDIYSSGFWKKYFEREYYIDSMKSMSHLIQQHGISSVIYWNPLFDIL